VLTATKAPRFSPLHQAAHVLWSTVRLYRANGSLRAWGVLGRHAALRLCGRRVPAFLHIEPTRRCQCQCVHCCAPRCEANSPGELSLAELRMLLDQARALGVLQVIFTGGEPLLRDDTDEAVRHAHRAGLLTRVNTNGVLLSRERAERLREAGLTEAAVSLDSADAATHDRLRGRTGTFDAAVQGIRNLTAAGIQARVQVCATPDNIPDGVRALIALARQLGAHSVRILPVRAVGRWAASGRGGLAEESLAVLRSLQDVGFVGVELPTERSVCAALRRDSLSITPDGDVTMCPAVPFVMGNVRRHPLAVVWRAHGEVPLALYQGNCPINDPAVFAALREHAQAVASRLP